MVVSVVFLVGRLFWVYVTGGLEGLRNIFFVPFFGFIFCGQTNNRNPGQAEAQTTERTLEPSSSQSRSRSVPPYVPQSSPTPSPSMSRHVPAFVSLSAPPSISTYVPASEPPSVSAYIPTSALPYVIPYTTSQEPSAQATLISPEAAAGYDTATAVVTMRPL